MTQNLLYITAINADITQVYAKWIAVINIVYLKLYIWNIVLKKALSIYEKKLNHIVL